MESLYYKFHDIKGELKIKKLKLLEKLKKLDPTDDYIIQKQRLLLNNDIILLDSINNKIDEIQNKIYLLTDYIYTQ